MKKTLLTLALFSASLFALEVGNMPKTVTLEGENGGYVKDASSWSSQSIKDKVYVLFYVDPDEKDTNSHFSAALKAKGFDAERFGSIAIINLAATWTPNFVLEGILEDKQKEFPRTIYVKDKNKVLVDAWSVGDDASNVAVFNKNGKVLFYKSGKMSEDDIAQAMSLIEANL